jgi:hypothetical protein
MLASAMAKEPALNFPYFAKNIRSYPPPQVQVRAP